MRTSALIALLPLLATSPAALARPHDHHHRHSDVHHGKHHVRKSLSFGPEHKHKTFEVLEQPQSQQGLQALGQVDVIQVARQFIGDRIGAQDGEGFFIRDDTYTDASTGITHVHAKQLLNGLEVSDGDINLNIDSAGNVISWGSSFHPGAAPSLSLSHGPSGETERLCSILEATIDAHKAELKRVKSESEGDKGPWALVKAAAQVVLPGYLVGDAKPEVNNKDEIRRIRKTMRKVKHHKHALCSDDQFSVQQVKDGHLSPVEALVSLLPRLQSKKHHDSHERVEPADFYTTTHHSLQPKPAPAEPPTQVISGEGLAKSGVVGDVPARLMYTQTSEGEPRLAWKMEVEMRDSWYEAYADAQTGELLRIVDWANDYSWDGRMAKLDDKQVDIQKGGKQKPLPKPPKKYEPYSYQVFPWGVNDPTTGNTSVVTKPWDTTASPLGWHEIPTVAVPWTAHIPGMNITGNSTTFYTTAGNNVIAHEDWEGRNDYILNYRPVDKDMVFVYDYGEPDGLAPKEYIDMVVTQLFYTSNAYHDLLYRLGFDEISGNFQASNFGLGGRGGDPVITNAQDGSGYNNANFMTPPDGTMPRMRMYVWDTATPYRDGDLEAGIVIHEYSHGLSTRLTGGPMNSGCLGYGEAGGMGEGWGDAMATLIRQIEEHSLFSNNTDTFAMGAWAANRDAGIRNYKYATNSTTNPSTYKTLDKPGYWGVHAIGEVWAEFLFVMAERLVEKYGFSPTLFPPSNTSAPNEYYTTTLEASVDDMGKQKPLIPKHGNTLAAQLIVDAMKLQPCRPSFFDARDAIIQADQIRTGGANACLIWQAFAERGLGADAAVIGQTPWGGGVRTDGYKVPSKICKKHQ